MHFTLPEHEVISMNDKIYNQLICSSTPTYILVLGNISKFNRIVILKHYRVRSYAP